MPFIEATKDATALRVFKLDDMAKKLFEIFGGDPDLVYTRDELQAMDERAQQQQAAMMAQPMADAMNKGASAVDKLASAQGEGGERRPVVRMTAYVISEALIADYRFVFGTAEGQRRCLRIFWASQRIHADCPCGCQGMRPDGRARQLALYIAGFDSFDYGRYKKLWPQTKPKENDDV